MRISPSHRWSNSSRRCCSNTLAILAEDGAGPEHIVRMTCYVTDRDEYLASRDELAPVVEVDHGRELSGDGAGRSRRAWSNSAALVEIEATAVVPE